MRVSTLRQLFATCVIASTLTSSRTADAQPVAEPAGARPRAEPAETRRNAGLGVGVSVGVVDGPGADRGWIARLEYELLPALPRRGEVGGYLGLMPAFQLWRGEGGWGLGVPFVFGIGVRAPGVRLGAVAGVEMLLVDTVDGDTGVGLYAPLAGVQLAADVRGWHVGADARVTRRWQFGADDFTQWQAAISIGHTWEPRLTTPIR